MMNDYRISAKNIELATNDVEANVEPTIGAFATETLNMQVETSALLCKLMLMVSGEECTATPVKPEDNILSMLSAIKENQRDIMRAIQAIMYKL